ncbi:MAG: Glutamate--tRNA ligase [Firmicutes bacterium ADurb.Bin193]|nr:MAG: Glutamate--tRNA ligase [Firmicutes bacterium ADurb.Bin193]
MKVRTRFAPSPTGYMHIGNLRTALYAYLITKSQGGDFILRIEDTDRERYVEGAVDMIYKTLRETGLIWDEGPDIGGDYGPYVQSQRKEIYKKYAEKLVALGGAYYCFCKKERLDEVRQKQEAQKLTPRYDGFCSNLSHEEVLKKLESGEPWVIRQRVPKSGTTSFDDVVFGTITVPNDSLDDGILLKSDGLPTYNFANVVDDHLMGITHIVRGSEYLSSTPKYNLLYNAFGWDIPVYIHCSPVMRDHSRKLSKRDGDASYEDFIKKGYLKEAVINYIALLGWSPRGEREKYTLNELVNEFDIKGISKSSAIFDEAKLAWLNGEYIRELSQKEFYEKAIGYINLAVKNDRVDKFKISELLQKRCERLSDIPGQIDFFDKMPEYDIELFTHKKMKTDPAIAKTSLLEILPVLEGVSDWSEGGIDEALKALVERLGIKTGQLLYPLRIALSGKAVTPGGGTEIAVILGKEETLLRVKKAIEKLA